MESREAPPQSQETLSSNTESNGDSSKPSVSSMAAADQTDNETMAKIKEPCSLEEDQGVDVKEDVSMDTSVTQEEVGNKKEPGASQQNVAPDVQKGEKERERERERE